MRTLPFPLHIYLYVSRSKIHGNIGGEHRFSPHVLKLGTYVLLLWRYFDLAHRFRSRPPAPRNANSPRPLKDTRIATRNVEGESPVCATARDKVGLYVHLLRDVYPSSLPCCITNTVINILNGFATPLKPFKLMTYAINLC